MDKKFRKLIKYQIFQLAHTNSKILRKVSDILRCCQNGETVTFSNSLFKLHKMYTSLISDQKLHPEEIRETTNKYKLPVDFYKAKMYCDPSANI